MFLIDRQELSEIGRFNRVIFLVLVTIILLYTFFVNPTESNLFICSFKEHTGYDCLSCGLTRSFHSISHLNIMKGFEHHLFGPVLYFSIMVLTLKFLIEIFTNSIWKLHRS
jgi:hypothetical protein